MVRRLLGKEFEVNTFNGSLKQSIRILVVDDEPLMAQPLADALAAEGYEIDMAANGQRALEKINDRAYDLILITGAIEHPDYQRFLAQTPVPVLAKPFSLSALYALTRQVLSASRRDVE